VHMRFPYCKVAYCKVPQRAAQACHHKHITILRDHMHITLQSSASVAAKFCLPPSTLRFRKHTSRAGAKGELSIRWRRMWTGPGRRRGGGGEGARERGARLAGAGARGGDYSEQSHPAAPATCAPLRCAPLQCAPLQCALCGCTNSWPAGS